jgi:hypothetical protein
MFYLFCLYFDIPVKLEINGNGRCFRVDFLIGAHQTLFHANGKSMAHHG